MSKVVMTFTDNEDTDMVDVNLEFDPPITDQDFANATPAQTLGVYALSLVGKEVAAAEEAELATIEAGADEPSDPDASESL